MEFRENKLGEKPINRAFTRNSSSVELTLSNRKLLFQVTLLNGLPTVLFNGLDGSSQRFL